MTTQRIARPSLPPLPEPQDEPTIGVVLAGRYLGLSRSGSYDAAKRGDIPTIKVGHRILVPTASYRRMLGIDADGGNAA